MLPHNFVDLFLANPDSLSLFALLHKKFTTQQELTYLSINPNSNSRSPRVI
jgi:hypothetical protein